MKILAIRGKNLASLSAEFAIDFLSEPLASAGLYAITGPTGSGKSTLLDALCLALYERTPRLSRATAKGEAIPDVGANTVAPGDPRTILRRGAGEGFAEVDFVGSDGVAYRARWSVRRSRLKADGKLQASEITLTRIVDNQRLGDHTKTETLRLIEARIGLSFEQFTRAVLLAQNDFATFLKAPDDERAELLQTLTGTETFAELSKQAYARMKAEKEALDRLQSQLQDQLPMAPDARSAKDAQLLAQQDLAAQLATQQAGIEEQLRWYQQWAQRQAEQAEAGAQLEAAVAARVAAAPRQAQLQLLEQVQPARPLRADAQRLTQAAAEAAQTALDAGSALERAQQQALEREGLQATAREQLAAADDAKAQAQPDIDQARVLDASIAALEPRYRAAQQAQADAQAQRDTALAGQAQTAMQIEATQTALRSAQDWLDDKAPLRPLAEGWQLWEALLAQAQLHLADQSTLESALEGFAQKAADNAKHMATAQTTLDQANQHATASAGNLDALAARCAAIDGEQLARDKQALELSRDALQAAAHLWQRRCELRAQRKQLQDQQQAETATLQASEAELQDGTQQLPLREAELQAAEQALQRAQLAASEKAGSLRDALQPGQPCPVCGALEHPYASHAPVVGAMLQSLRDHVTERRKALRALQDAFVRAGASKASATKALAQFSQEQTAQEARHAALLVEWTALALHDAIEAVPLADRDAWLQQRQEAARASLQALAVQEARLRENLKLRDAAQVQLNAANKTLEQARETVNTLAASAAGLTQSSQTAQRQLEERAGQLEQVLAQLDAPFAGPAWRPQWLAHPQAFVAQCRSDADAWTRQQESRSTLAGRIEKLQVELAAAATACSRAEQQLLAQTTACQSEADHLNALRQQRAALLQGRAVTDAEQSLQTALQQARAAWEAAQASLQQARDGVHRLQESVRQAGLQGAQLRSALATAQAALDDWLESFNASLKAMQASTVSPPQSGPLLQPGPALSPSPSPSQPLQGPAQEPLSALQALQLEQLDVLLAITPGWISTEREALHALHTAESAACAVLDTRQRSLVAHEAARATEKTAEVLQQELQQASEAMSAATAALSALRVERTLDDQRLLQSAALRLQIEQQMAAARVWSQLGELIGSADGKKFRNFAQQLTLDILLGYGNRHLQSLSARYKLQRIQDSLGLLVVDQDMGDELRSVHSLSGGESFLVSLAMALGLASLSSHRVRVESLFIDEGFGSLDADSLRVAMDALDRLQSQGRKVGVISHVQEMTERIGTRVQVQRQAGGLSRIVVA